MGIITTLHDYTRPTETRVVAVSGCFDLIHIGHISFFTEAKRKGDRLIVLLENDQFIRTFKKKEPFHTQNERAEILSHIDLVDEVVLLPFLSSESDYANMWSVVQPSIIALTKGDPYLNNKQKQVEKYGGKVLEVISLVPKVSSTLAHAQNQPNKKAVE